MNFSSGYYFFENKEESPACGYVLLRYGKNGVKIQCVAEKIPSSCGRSAMLRFIDSCNMEQPFTVGRVYLNGSGSGQWLRGEQNFLINSRAFLPGNGKYNGMELVSEQTRAQILCTALGPGTYEDTKAEEKESTPPAPFDPFRTTNPSYSWHRVCCLEGLRKELMANGIHPSPELGEELKRALGGWKHILLGNYKPRDGMKSYFLLGIPGKQPPEDPNKIYRWINKCVELPEYPDFDGYKLFYYDRDTGGAVKAVLRK